MDPMRSVAAQASAARTADRRRRRGAALNGRDGRKSIQLSAEQHAILRHLSDTTGMPMSRLHDWALALLQRAPELEKLMQAARAAEEACGRRPSPP